MLNAAYRLQLPQRKRRLLPVLLAERLDVPQLSHRVVVVLGVLVARELLEGSELGDDEGQEVQLQVDERPQVVVPEVLVEVHVQPDGERGPHQVCEAQLGLVAVLRAEEGREVFEGEVGLLVDLVEEAGVDAHVVLVPGLDEALPLQLEVEHLVDENASVEGLWRVLARVHGGYDFQLEAPLV